MLEDLPEDDRVAVAAFRNFLSWGEKPASPTNPYPYPGIARPVPPAWWAYTMGYTRWCPPKGEW